MSIALVCRLAPDEPVTLNCSRPFSLAALRFISYSSTPPSQQLSPHSRISGVHGRDVRCGERIRQHGHSQATLDVPHQRFRAAWPGTKYGEMIRSSCCADSISLS